MGSEKVAIIKDSNDRLIATKHLLNDLKAMEMMLERDLFETGARRIGVEQEISLVGNDWKPAPVLMELLKMIDDDHFTTEFATFNMEINLDPLALKEDCFSQLEKNLWRFLAKGEKNARQLNSHLILTGILPTLNYSDIDLKNITPLQRYYDLVEALKDLRGDNFEFKIQGQDQWISRAENCFFESSNTSFQVHYQIDPDDFQEAYNWSLAIAAPVLAMSVNSPLLLGKRLWHETRIALFQQATDVRSSAINYREKIPRVNFGWDWIQGSVLNFYQENAFRHKIILASTRNEDAVEKVELNEVPRLYGLNTHLGTVYNWNRPCYGITDGKPHIRIENRVMPSGPTVIDEVANSAFWIGLMHGMPEEFKDIHLNMDFGKAKMNFHTASRIGISSTLYWPKSKGQIPVKELILKELIPIAKDGLNRAKINSDDISKFLGIIEERVSSERTGARWMISSFDKLLKTNTKDQALVNLTAGMSSRQQKGDPVHTWDTPSPDEARNWLNKYQTIEQIMKTELFTVSEEDPIELVKKIMKWRNVRHIPVENNIGEFTGIISCRNLLFNENNPQTAQDIMQINPITVNPSMSTFEAIKIMEKEKADCLPVVMGNNLVGLVTERDFISIASLYLNQEP